MRWLLLTATLGASLWVWDAQNARADEQIVPLAESGTWMAAAHKESMADPPDICIAEEAQSNFALRADTNGVQLRLSNNSWSLPSGVTGQLEVKVGSYDQAFDIDDNTDTMVNAEVSQDQVGPLLNAIANGSIMTVIAGKAKPIDVSLAGSATALNAFRTCAGISGSAPGGGSDPFQ